MRDTEINPETISPDGRKSPEDTSPAPKKRQHGPQKEKTQFTIRIDKQLADQASAQMKQTKIRITDMLERGLVLALKEQDQDLPLVSTQVRFLVANTTKEQQLHIRRFLLFLVLNDLENLSALEVLLRKTILEYLELIERVPDLYQRALKLYSRYGRT